MMLCALLHLLAAKVQINELFMPENVIVIKSTSINTCFGWSKNPQHTFWLGNDNSNIFDSQSFGNLLRA